ncbi:UTP:GlnB (protein PII) uridylyltransferase [Desulfosporosinus orientis DSM 765]|uniref:UTP:GlnB (Protein PII) uridylyltransferase n=1 Tax=Desulfosporosinus orientis (strain ATCC 19365 / DSM 765 / NCIMB 8382 / VKM B-1628 / Singapore I) TaxID=768706 RepID=G7WH26_DESOD|nr:HD domain-containing protein [Desulfosporosinus orientis]AET69534.1 UTP:GlnB (protein PII) uridylyltransferase [Desulfosporosinus orientis DSM 765]
MITFAELEAHLLRDEKPADFFNQLRKTGFFQEQYPFTMLGALEKVPQSPKHHPEGSVWNHTMLVLDNAGEWKHLSKNPRAFMWSALLHDLGKAPATKIRKGRITSYDHDILGEKLAVDFLKELCNDQPFIQQVAKLVRWHMQILFVIKELPFADIKKMSAEVSIEEIALLGLCDRLGRGNMTRDKKLEVEKSIMTFLEKCNRYQCV